MVPDESAIAEPSKIIVVGAPEGWSWRDCCKTQYAHRYGRDHFLRCHLGLIKLLDFAKEIGILERVSDDGDYWETRSVDVLIKNLHRNDSIVAAFVGGIRDAIEGSDSGGAFVAPITNAPDFEQLEAEGIAQIGGEFPQPVGDIVAARVRAIASEPYDAPLFAWPQPADPEHMWPPLESSIAELQALNQTLEPSILKDVYGMTYSNMRAPGLTS